MKKYELTEETTTLSERTLRENNAEQTAHKLVTCADWEAAESFEKAANPGDYVEECIIDQMRDCLPPACMNFGFLQMGEPYSHELDPDTGKWKPTFMTFKKDGQHWTYCGNCFYKQDTPPRSEMHHGMRFRGSVKEVCNAY